MCSMLVDGHWTTKCPKTVRTVPPRFGLPAFLESGAESALWGRGGERGSSIYKVSQWLEHRSVSTTMIYAHLAPQDDEINVL